MKYDSDEFIDMLKILLQEHVTFERQINAENLSEIVDRAADFAEIPEKETNE